MVYKRFYRFLRHSANTFLKDKVLTHRSCSFCGLSANQDGLCQSCESAIARKGHHCYQCGFEFKDNQNSDNTINEQTICGHCIKQPPNYHHLISACDYQFPVNNAISRLKFNRQLHIGKALNSLLINQIKAHYQEKPLPQAIIPIPLHRKRLSERGFNQSLLIAKPLSTEFDIPLVANKLIRIVDTPHQIGLKAKERKRNLKNAFEIRANSAPLPKHIALIDDVVTTGSTISEASRICSDNGVEKIDIWCLAKT